MRCRKQHPHSITSSVAFQVAKLAGLPASLIERCARRCQSERSVGARRAGDALYAQVQAAKGLVRHAGRMRRWRVNHSTPLQAKQTTSPAANDHHTPIGSAT